jgi:hypothetical protein
MLKTVKAVLEKDGRIRLLEKVDLARSKRVLVTFLEEEPAQEDIATSQLSEPALAQDWNRPEEDEAWRHLQ